MVNIEVCFGNNNTLNIDLPENTCIETFVSLVNNILFKENKTMVIIDGKQVLDPNAPVSNYLRSDGQKHHAWFVWTTERQATTGDLLADFLAQYSQPVPVVIANPSEYLIERSQCDEPCAYCGEEMADDIVEVRSCHHIFHRSCITTWLSEVSVKCPTCNVDVR